MESLRYDVAKVFLTPFTIIFLFHMCYCGVHFKTCLADHSLWRAIRPTTEKRMLLYSIQQTSNCHCLIQIICCLSIRIYVCPPKLPRDCTTFTILPPLLLLSSHSLRVRVTVSPGFIASGYQFAGA